MNSSAATAVGYVCIAAVIMFGLAQCGAKVDPRETAAIAEACAKVGKEPSITIRSGDGVRMGCAPSPAASR